MELIRAFEILGLAQTREKENIIRAYRQCLPQNNPEDNPEGFKRLREAYENAMEYAKQEKSAVDIWLETVDRAYQNLPERCRTDVWEKIFQDKIFDRLDVEDELESKFMDYLMEHCELPRQIWKIINKAFSITERREDFEGNYPPDFLNYVEYSIQNDGFIRFELFEYRDDEYCQCQGDEYIRALLSAKAYLDKGIIPDITELSMFEVYHPYEDVQRIRINICQGEYLEAQKIIDKLLVRYADDLYIQLYYGVVLYYLKDTDRAEAILREIIGTGFRYRDAYFYLAKCMVSRGAYYDARDIVEILLEQFGKMDNDIELLMEINKYLLEDMKECMSTGRKNEKYNDKILPIEYTWCLLQNGKYDEAVEYISDYPYAEDYPYEYNNLTGRLLFETKNYQAAESRLKKLLEIIESYMYDGTEETMKRMRRLPMIATLIAQCCVDSARYEEALTYIEKAIEKSVNTTEEIEARNVRAEILLKWKKFQEAIDECDRIIGVEDKFYPAYLTRQEAFYYLHRAREVILDYLKCVNLYSGYYRPYNLAADVYMRYKMYDESLKVLYKAEENNVVFSDNMKLVKAICLRNSKRQREAMEILSDIENEEGTLNQTIHDIEDMADVYFEKGLLYEEAGYLESGIKMFEKALQINNAHCRANERLIDYYSEMYDKGNIDEGGIRRAIELCTNAMKGDGEYYFLIMRGRLYMQISEYDGAMKDFEYALKIHDDDWSVWNNIGSVYHCLGEYNNAEECYNRAIELLGGEKNEKPYRNLEKCRRAMKGL